MPPGPKKRKANKRKKEKETTNPNPNSIPLPSTLLPLPYHQGNGQENHGSTDEERDEKFETPKPHPDAAVVDPQLDNGFGGTKVVDSVETKEDLASEEESTRNHQPRPEDLEVRKDSVPEAPIESIDAYASREKEVKIVPMMDEQEKTHIGDTVVERSLKENSDVTEEFVTENHVVSVEEVNNFNVEYEVKEDSTKVTNSDEMAKDSLVGITENDKDKVHEPSRVDEDLKGTQLDTLSREKYMLTEHPIFVTEEVSQHSKATAQVLNKVLVGIVDSPFPEKGVKDIGIQDHARIEIAPKTEVVCGPLVVRRATLWNCCGLLDVVTGSRS